MVDILEPLPNLGALPLLVELTSSCPTFSGGNWGKVVLVINFSLLRSEASCRERVSSPV